MLSSKKGLEISLKTLAGLGLALMVILLLTSYALPRISPKAYFISYYAEDVRMVLEELQGTPFDAKIMYSIEDGIIIKIKDNKVIVTTEDGDEKLTKAIRIIPGTTIGEGEAKGLLIITKKGKTITFNDQAITETNECGNKPSTLKKINPRFYEETTGFKENLKSNYLAILEPRGLISEETNSEEIIIKQTTGPETKIIISYDQNDQEQKYLACKLKEKIPSIELETKEGTLTINYQTTRTSPGEIIHASKHAEILAEIINEQ